MYMLIAFSPITLYVMKYCFHDKVALNKIKIIKISKSPINDRRHKQAVTQAMT